MNMVRIACAYGNQKELELLIARIRDASIQTKRLCGIILETHGSHAMVGPVLITPKQSQLSDIKHQEPLITPFNLQPEPNELELIASALNMQIDTLPQNILQNASFAVNNIINSHQLTAHTEYVDKIYTNTLTNVANTQKERKWKRS